MIRFYSNIGCSESKVIFMWRKNNKTNQKRLYKEQTFVPRVFHSVSTRAIIGLNQNSHRTTQTQTNVEWQTWETRLEPAIRDAQKLVQIVFPPWRPTLTSRSLQSIARPFQSLQKCSDFDLLPFYERLGRKLFTQIPLRMVLFSVCWKMLRIRVENIFATQILSR